MDLVFSVHIAKQRRFSWYPPVDHASSLTTSCGVFVSNPCSPRRGKPVDLPRTFLALSRVEHVHNFFFFMFIVVRWCIPTPTPPPCLLCNRSSLARNRPVSAEPLHGFSANVQLVSILGKRPEEEDPAIAKEWSPRGGRKRRQQSLQESPRGRTGSLEGAVVNGGEEDADRGESQRRRFRPRSSSGSRSPRRQRTGAQSRKRAGRRHSRVNSSYRSPGVIGRRKCFSLRRSGNYRRDHGGDGDGDGDGGGGGGDSGGDGSAGSLVSCDDDWLSVGNATNGSGSNDSDDVLFDTTCFDPSMSSGLISPGHSPSRGGESWFSHGNLGGRFSLPDSPYRTFRAKHARLVRAQSSERAVAATARRRRARENIPGGGSSRWPNRSRSADTVRRRDRRQRGRSGMASPLLQGEGFGLLESIITGKVSLCNRWGCVLPCIDWVNVCGGFIIYGWAGCFSV